MESDQPSVSHERLLRICCTDYNREIALVAERQDTASGAHEIIAVGRLIKWHSRDAAEFALLISDRFQRCGLDTELLRRLLDVGRAEQIHRIVADILPENTRMLHICQRLGFQLKHSIDEPVKAEIEL